MRIQSSTSKYKKRRTTCGRPQRVPLRLKKLGKEKKKRLKRRSERLKRSVYQATPTNRPSKEKTAMPPNPPTKTRATGREVL